MPFDHSRQIKPFEISRVSAAVRSLTKQASTTEELASSITRVLFDSLTVEPSGEKACSLVRFFRTVDFHLLESDLQEHVRKIAGNRKPNDRCLTLFGTAGVEEQWNDRKRSVGHSAIPLLSAEMVAELPMISRLFTQLGIEISSLFEASRSGKLKFTDPADRDYNIFYVQDAQNSEFIPAKSSFVKPYGIRTVIGYGSILPDGDLYAVILFFKIVIPEAALKQFTALALSTTIAVLSLPDSSLFSSQ